MNIRDLLFWRHKKKEIKEETAHAKKGVITQANIKNFIVKAVGQVDTGRGNDFEEPSPTLSEIKVAVNADSYIRLAIVKYSQLIFKAGYNIVSNNDLAAEYISSRLRMMSFMTGIPIDNVFQEVAMDLVAYSNAFLIKSRVDMTSIGGLSAKGIYDTKPVGGYFRVDPTTMSIKRDKSGAIKGYQQSVNNQDKKYKVTDVIHFFIDKEGGASFGSPRIETALEDVKLLRKIEGNVLKLLYRFSSPLFQMRIGLPEEGFMATDKEIGEAKSEIEKLADDGIIITNERTEFRLIGAEGNALDIAPYLRYFEKRVFAALQLSDQMVGRNDIKNGNADSMEEQVHDTVKFIQKSLKSFIENYIFTELLLEGGFNPIMNEEDIVYFQFHEINLDTKVKMETHAINKFQGNAISFDEMRTLLGLRSDNVDMTSLYANLIQKTNELEIISAKEGHIPGKSKEYAPNKQINNTIAPENQHGKHTATIKESHEDKGRLEREKEFEKNYKHLVKTYHGLRNDICSDRKNKDIAIPIAFYALEKYLIEKIEETGKEGYEKALIDLGAREDIRTLVPLGLLKEKVRKGLTKLLTDIKDSIEYNASIRDIEEVFHKEEYRLRFLANYIVGKAYWYAYVKACHAHGIEKVYVDFSSKEDAKGKKKVIYTSAFTLDDIPRFHAYCKCQITKKGEGVTIGSTT